jgi:CRP-like cAMP-binding protein
MVSLDLLKKLSLFREVPPVALEQLARNAEVQSYKKGDILCEEGQKGEGFYLIVSGSATVEKKLFHGDNSRKVVARLGPEQFFGEMAFLQNQPYSATVVAQEDTVILTLSRTGLNDMANKEPKVALDQVLTMMTGLSDRLRSTTRELITIFEVARVLGEGLPLDGLASKVIEQLSLNLAGDISIGFYQWNPFNDEYTLVRAVGPQKKEFVAAFEPSRPITPKSGYYLFSQIDMSDKREGLLLYHADEGTTFSSGEKQMIETVAAVLAPALASARLREEEAARQKLQRSKQQGNYL